ncbi:MAG: TspO/MBR family protein [Pseudomonadota bacterium]
MLSFLKLVLWIAVFLAISFGIGQLTAANIESWYALLDKPRFTPPNLAFPIVWSILYALIATTGWFLWQQKELKEEKKIYAVYVALNWLWSPVFFGLHQPMLGFFWIIAVNAVNIVFILKARKTLKIGAILMIFPLLWTLFAAYLNLGVWILND